MSNFFNELKNRNVYKVATAYVVTSWLILQAVETLGNNLGWPSAIAYWTTLLLIVGFPIALVLTWLYEFTPQGLKRTGTVQQDTADNRKAGRRLNHIIIGVLAVALCFMLVERVFFAGNTSINKKQEASIAVLPFENISVLENSENFAKGLTEQILNDLALLSGLKVIAPNSSFYLQDKNMDDLEIAKQLDVNYLLKGSLQYDESSNRIKVITRLVNANNGYYLWSDAYEADFIEIFDIQEDVSRNVASQLRVQLQPQEDKALGAKLTENSKALKLYLESKNYTKKRTDRDLREAIDLLNQAVKLEPDFAEAHAELSWLYSLLYAYGSLTKEERNKAKKIHLSRALELAPEKPEVLHAKAEYNMVILGEDSTQVIADLRKAIELKPNYADAYYSLNRALGWAGNPEIAIKYLEKALELDPYNEFFASMLAGRYFYVKNDHTRAFDILDKIIESDSSLTAARTKGVMVLGEPYGDLVQAYKLFHTAGKSYPNEQWNLNYHLHLSNNLDLIPVAKEYGRRSQMRYPDAMYMFNSLCTLYALTEEYDKWLELVDFWVADKGIDKEIEALNRAALQKGLGNYDKAKVLLEETFPYLTKTISGDEIANLQPFSAFYDSFSPLLLYIEVLRLQNDASLADSFAAAFCEFADLELKEDPSQHQLLISCLYASNDTLSFVKKLGEKYFVKNDRGNMFTDIKMGSYRRFEKNRKVRDLFNRITEDTHRMRAEVIAYLKEEGDWDPAWDKELGLE
ncbi:tetratricopeptide repeat protein [Robiginitalea sp. IMCC44478]|uniref:tetratricopeptide repeat protein n=1 Tax=Robiginitalea sp. IMCC44478 TaxID=3459122 RepID=UPI0040429673